MKETTKPMAKTTQPSALICETPIGFPPLPITDFSRSYPVAATMVGIERKKENSSAEARDMPASWPAAMVDMDRDVPGKTAERIWQAPIQIAWPRLIASIFQVWMRLFGAVGPA